MKQTAMDGVFIQFLFAVCVVDLARSDGDECKFYETFHSTHAESNSFIVENMFDSMEDTSQILHGSGQSVTRPVDARYRVRLPRNAPFRPLTICVTSNIDRVIFVVYDANDNSHTERIDNPTSMGPSEVCMEQPGAVEKVTKVIIRFSTTMGDAYEMSDLLVEACAGEQVCGWSQYEDAGIEGGSMPQEAVVGGWVARPHEFPWQATLVLTVNSNLLCGGSVIDSQYLITAAHCVDGLAPEDLFVLLGNEQLFVFNDNQQAYTVAEIIQHIYYWDSYLYNDIALLRLSTEIPEWTDAIRPICMPRQPVRDIVGVSFTVSGWGATTEGGPSFNNELLYTSGLPAMSFHACETCQNNYNLEFFSVINDIVLDGMMCAGFCGENDRDSCQGDSGGPLVRKNEDGAWELVGVASWGFGCAGAVPGVYSDVYFYKYWIEENAPLATEPLFG